MLAAPGWRPAAMQALHKPACTQAPPAGPVALVQGRLARLVATTAAAVGVGAAAAALFAPRLPRMCCLTAPSPKTARSATSSSSSAGAAPRAAAASSVHCCSVVQLVRCCWCFTPPSAECRLKDPAAAAAACIGDSSRVVELSSLLIVLWRQQRQGDRREAGGVVAAAAGKPVARLCMPPRGRLLRVWSGFLSGKVWLLCPSCAARLTIRAASLAESEKGQSVWGAGWDAGCELRHTKTKSFVLVTEHRES